jgi:hypothetical protein
MEEYVTRLVTVRKIQENTGSLYVQGLGKRLRWMGDVKAVTTIVPLTLAALPHRKLASAVKSVTAAGAE